MELVARVEQFRQHDQLRARIGCLGDEFRWASSGMVSDVEAWLEGSAGNYGWILLGDESQSGTSVKFASREYEILDYRPRLVIDYSIVPEPSTALLVACGLLGLAVIRRRGA